jgi:hypothetical protein
MSKFKTLDEIYGEATSGTRQNFNTILKKEYISKEELYEILAKHWAHDINKILILIREELERD